MDTETAKYIIDHYSKLLSVDENMALKHFRHQLTLENTEPEKREKLTSSYKKIGWITDDKTLLDLLNDGIEAFELNAAQKILANYADKVFLNICPKCQKLARTPEAKQCRYCYFDWHYNTQAQFNVEDCFPIANRQFFLLGQITEGIAKRGYIINLNPFSIDKKPIIETVETVRKQNWQGIAIGINNLTDTEKELIKNNIGSGKELIVFKA
jgi:hypothetical protein